MHLRLGGLIQPIRKNGITVIHLVIDFNEGRLIPPLIKTNQPTRRDKMTKEEMFADVSFQDKVAVYFEDGSMRVFKHLYYDASELDAIDWDSVINCHEV